MGPPKSTPNEYERTIHKGREKEINKTTAGPLPICSPLKKIGSKKESGKRCKELWTYQNT